MTTVSKWEIFELSLTSEKSFANPFLEVSLRAEFRSGGRVFSADGFYDGCDTGSHLWKVRFAPMEEGTWQYRTYSDLPELDGREGEFLCTEADSRGGLRVNPEFPNWFVREDGKPQMICNEGWFPHPANGIDLAHEDREFRQPSEDDFKKYIDIISGGGVNMIIDVSQLYARQESVTDTTFRWPWKVVDAEHNKFDCNFFNLAYYRRMEHVLSYAKGKDLFFAQELLYDNSVVRPREWSHHPLNRMNGGWLDGVNGIGWGAMFDLSNPEHMMYTERYLRYTIARLAPYWNLLWSVGSENGNLAVLPPEILPGSLTDIGKVSEWYNYWGAFIARRDPYGRLRSYGDAGKITDMVTNAGNSFIITQDPRNYRRTDVSYYYKAINAFGEDFWKYGRPVIIGEMTAATNNHYEVERRLYWIGFVSGCHMARADRHFGTVVEGKYIESEKFGISGVPPIYADIKRLGEFVAKDDVRYWRMRPNDRLVSSGDSLVFCLAAEDEEYVLYFVSGGTASLKVPACACRWYNPRTGEFREEKPACGTVSFTAPDGEDWVLHLTAETRP